MTILPSNLKEQESSKETASDWMEKLEDKLEKQQTDV